MLQPGLERRKICSLGFNVTSGLECRTYLSPPRAGDQISYCALLTPRPPATAGGSLKCLTAWVMGKPAKLMSLFARSDCNRTGESFESTPAAGASMIRNSTRCDWPVSAKVKWLPMNGRRLASFGLGPCILKRSLAAYCCLTYLICLHAAAHLT